MTAIKYNISQNEIPQTAREISKILDQNPIVFLRGNLGSGKTFLVQQVLKNLNFNETTSPTFPIMNIYQLPNFTVYHCDLYRIKHPNELLFIGIDDIDGPIFIEWPEILEESNLNMKPDFDITIKY